MRAALLAVVGMIAACGDDGTSSSSTSLEGTVSCGTLTCTTGQVCRIYEGGGIDAATGSNAPTYDCVTVPSSCPIADCSMQCSACIDQLCSPTPAYSVVGRELRCLVQ